MEKQGKWENEGTLPYKHSVGGNSICYTLASIGVDTDIEKVHFDMGFSYAYIYIQPAPDKIESVLSALNWYFRNATEVPAPVLKSYNARLIVVNEAGVNEYICDSEIFPANTEENN